MPSWSDIGLGAVMNPGTALSSYGIGGSVNPMNWFEGGQGDAAAQQRDLIEQLKLAASGQGPSVADAQMKAGLGRINAQSQSMAASQLGMNPAAAQRLAMLARVRAGTQATGQAAANRAQEQIAARGQLMDAINAYRQAEAAKSAQKWQRFAGLVGAGGAAASGGATAGAGAGGGGTQMAMMGQRQPNLVSGGLVNPFSGGMEPGTGSQYAIDRENPYAPRRY